MGTQAYEYGNLYSALAIMDATAARSADSVVRAMHRSFLVKLGLYGLQYPVAQRPHTALKREVIEKLTAEAIQVLNAMRVRASAARQRAPESAVERIRLAI